MLNMWLLRYSLLHHQLHKKLIKFTSCSSSRVTSKVLSLENLEMKAFISKTSRSYWFEAFSLSLSLVPLVLVLGTIYEHEGMLITRHYFFLWSLNPGFQHFAITNVLLLQQSRFVWSSCVFVFIGLTYATSRRLCVWRPTNIISPTNYNHACNWILVQALHNKSSTPFFSGGQKYAAQPKIKNLAVSNYE